MIIQVRDGANGFKVLQEIDREPVQHAGWQSIRFSGGRYQLFGGIRNPYFIDIANPIKSAREKKPMRCNQCEALMINGTFCHETGCPNTKARYDGLAFWYFATKQDALLKYPEASTEFAS